MNKLAADLPSGLPPLYAQQDLGGDAIVHVKFFTPDAGWTWYLTEYDPDTRDAFGLVVGQETEFGYFSLDELAAATGPFGLAVERDQWFDPTPVRDLPEAPVWVKGA